VRNRLLIDHWQGRGSDRILGVWAPVPSGKPSPARCQTAGESSLGDAELLRRLAGRPALQVAEQDRYAVLVRQAAQFPIEQRLYVEPNVCLASGFSLTCLSFARRRAAADLAPRAVR
jgi:hypothetical protein